MKEVKQYETTVEGARSGFLNVYKTNQSMVLRSLEPKQQR